MKGRRFIKGERGNVLILTTLALTFLLAMGGIAIDLAYLSVAKGELQRSVDAAALAGAGRLGRPAFGDSAFPDVRTWAQNYASFNPYRGGTVDLPAGNITLGIFSGGNFTPAADGSKVNAVQCNYATTIPTSFLKLLGLDTLPVAAEAVAVVSPPLTPPAGTCVFPLAVTQCSFSTPPGEPTPTFGTSNGCGKAVTATWVNLGGTAPPDATSTNAAINAAAAGAGCAVAPVISAEVGTTPTMGAAVMQNFISKLNAKKAASGTITVVDNLNHRTYSNTGWLVYTPVIQTPCPSGAITGARPIIGWTQVVLTQVVNGIFVQGFVDCTRFDAPYNPNPAPISALSTRLWLAR